MLVRRLKNHTWKSEDGKLIIYDKRRGVKIILDKVRSMSLHKFIPNHLDRIRIEGNRIWREKMGAMRERMKELRARKKK